MKFKHYELIENLDPHMAHFTPAEDGVYRESFYELDVVYLRFIRFNMVLQDRKQDLINIIQGQTLNTIKYRDILPTFVLNITTWNAFLIAPYFQGMYQRRTHLKFNCLQDLRNIYPEYFI